MIGSGLPASRPEAMADVPAVCEVPLTRAVVQYREEQDRSGRVPTVEDVGLALVLDGDIPSRSSCVDLGSGVIRTLDLGSQMVVLDWLYEPTRLHLRGLLEAGGEGRVPGLEVRRYCGEILHRILARTGFGPLARPTLLRLGFRDVARDLDPHEGAAVRILLAPSRVARIRLDPDNVRLVVATGSSVRDGELEAALSGAFPLFELQRVIPSAAEGTLSYLVLLPVPATPGELHALLDRIRKGIGRIMAGFEPERLVGVEAQLSTFGVRDTLSHLDLRDPRGRSEPMGRGSPASGPVH
jgi:hypothetical protein